MIGDPRLWELKQEYNRRSFKISLALLLVFAIIFGVPLGISYLYCEHITDQYAGDILPDIRNEVLSDGMMLVQFKILRYKDGLIPEAKVYAVTESQKSKSQQETVYWLNYRYSQWNIEESSNFAFAWPYELIPDFDLSVSIGP